MSSATEQLEYLMNQIAEIDRDLCDERDNAETLKAVTALDAAVGHLRRAMQLIASATEEEGDE